jgi:hypothetical protein
MSKITTNVLQTLSLCVTGLIAMAERDVQMGKATLLEEHTDADLNGATKLTKPEKLILKHLREDKAFVAKMIGVQRSIKAELRARKTSKKPNKKHGKDDPRYAQWCARRTDTVFHEGE